MVAISLDQISAGLAYIPGVGIGVGIGVVIGVVSGFGIEIADTVLSDG